MLALTVLSLSMAALLNRYSPPQLANAPVLLNTWLRLSTAAL
jgi:hypothetical protein